MFAGRERISIFIWPLFREAGLGEAQMGAGLRGWCMRRTSSSSRAGASLHWGGCQQERNWPRTRPQVPGIQAYCVDEWWVGTTITVIVWFAWVALVVPGLCSPCQVPSSPSFFFFFNWNIVALQCHVSFFCTAKWISHKYTYILSCLDFLPI